MSWTLQLTDKNYVPIGEIRNAGSLVCNLGLSKIDTMSFTVRLDNPLADFICTTAGYVKAYRDSTLTYFGSLLSSQESADTNGATVAVNSVGSGWVMSKRLVGKSATGTVFSTPTDRVTLVNTLLDAINVENETGISTVPGLLSGSTVTYTAGPYRFLTDIITDMSSSLDGFDWRVLPVENYIGGVVIGPKIGQFVAFPTIGVNQPNSVFEFGVGTRNNIVGYTRTVSRDTQANKVYHSVSAGPDAPGFPTIFAIDSGSIFDWHELEDIASADITDPTLRASLVAEHVNVRRYPRQVIQFTPHVDPSRSGRVPYYGVDYSLGDRVPARAVVGSSTRFDALMRVWGVQFNVDANGMETSSLTLADE